MGLPRSRTAWLAKFLSYSGFRCGHEELLHMRSLDDVRSWLAQPMTGTAETAAAPYWRLLRKMAPDARVVVVRRPVEDAVASFMRLETAETGPLDRKALTAAFRYGDAKLQQIAARWPGALAVDFAGLDHEETCARVFEHCLPYRHNPAWWRLLAPINVQCDFLALWRQSKAFFPHLMTLAEIGASEMRADIGRR